MGSETKSNLRLTVGFCKMRLMPKDMQPRNSDDPWSVLCQADTNSRLEVSESSSSLRGKIEKIVITMDTGFELNGN